MRTATTWIRCGTCRSSSRLFLNMKKRQRLPAENNRIVGKCLDWHVFMPTLRMKTFKIRTVTVMGKIIKFLLICLGFKSVVACHSTTEEYGTPYAEYEVKGRVSDAEGTPIQGIRVSMGESQDRYMDSVAVTDAEGRFHVIHGTFPFRDNTFDIQFTDIDGEAGGGLFDEQTVTVQAEMTEEGDGWDEGDYAVKKDVNVTLELKKDSEE